MTDTVKILLISFVAAILLGTLGGVIIGKIQVNRAKNGRKAVLSKKQRIIYGSCILAGVACILVGVFAKLPGTPDPAGPDGETLVDGEFMPGGDGFAGVSDGEIALANAEVDMAELGDAATSGVATAATIDADGSGSGTVVNANPSGGAAAARPARRQRGAPAARVVVRSFG